MGLFFAQFKGSSEGDFCTLLHQWAIKLGQNGLVGPKRPWGADPKRSIGCQKAMKTCFGTILTILGHFNILTIYFDILTILGYFRSFLDPFWAILDPQMASGAPKCRGEPAKMGQKGVNRP